MPEISTSDKAISKDPRADVVYARYARWRSGACGEGGEQADHFQGRDRMPGLLKQYFRDYTHMLIDVRGPDLWARDDYRDLNAAWT